MRLFDDDMHWVQVRDGNEIALSIFKRHYTYRAWRQRKGKNGKRIVGPGEQMILLEKNGKALFIWRLERYKRDGQYGLCCAVFRNESNVLSSLLLAQAEVAARKRWPHERFYTYVNAGKVKSANPGYCFKVNGWRMVGLTKAKKLVILEKRI